MEVGETQWTRNLRIRRQSAVRLSGGTDCRQILRALVASGNRADQAL